MVAAGVPSSKDDFKPALIYETTFDIYFNFVNLFDMKKERTKENRWKSNVSITLGKQRAYFLYQQYKLNPNARARSNRAELEATKIRVAVE